MFGIIRKSYYELLKGHKTLDGWKEKFFKSELSGN